MTRRAGGMRWVVSQGEPLMRTKLGAPIEYDREQQNGIIGIWKEADDKG
jgi:hypothetical protein